MDRKDRREKRDKGVPIGTKTDQHVENEDDGFLIVRNKDRKRKLAKKDDSESSEEAEDFPPKRGLGETVRGARVERGGNRGDRGGRGGFFKNSRNQE